MRTFADALREAREGKAMRPQSEPQMMGMMAAGGDLQDSGELATLEAKIVSTTGPAYAPNPRMRCDFCPRRQLADMCIEVEPGRYACDGCTSRWARDASGV